MSALWEFAVDVYGRPGVAEACLALQDRYGIDVSLMLYCCWAGNAGIALGETDITEAVELSAPWKNGVVAHLREARRWMKAGNGVRQRLSTDAYAELREAIKALELDAERLELLALESLAPAEPSSRAGDSGRLETTSANLCRYCITVVGSIDTTLLAHLTDVVAGACGADRVAAGRIMHSVATRAGAAP